MTFCAKIATYVFCNVDGGLVNESRYVITFGAPNKSTIILVGGIKVAFKVVPKLISWINFNENLYFNKNVGAEEEFAMVCCSFCKKFKISVKAMIVWPFV